jgi:hypothetical protein
MTNFVYCKNCKYFSSQEENRCEIPSEYVIKKLLNKTSDKSIIKYRLKNYFPYDFTVDCLIDFYFNKTEEKDSFINACGRIPKSLARYPKYHTFTATPSILNKDNDCVLHKTSLLRLLFGKYYGDIAGNPFAFFVIAWVLLALGVLISMLQ